jgi:hypothetical protein
VADAGALFLKLLAESRYTSRHPPSSQLTIWGFCLVSASWFCRFAYNLFRAFPGILVSGPHVSAVRQVCREPGEGNPVPSRFVNKEEEPVRPRSLVKGTHCLSHCGFPPITTRWTCVSSYHLLAWTISSHCIYGNPAPYTPYSQRVARQLSSSISYLS